VTAVERSETSPGAAEAPVLPRTNHGFANECCMDDVATGASRASTGGSERRRLAVIGRAVERRRGAQRRGSPFGAPTSAARSPSRSTRGPVLGALVVVGAYAVIVGAAGGSLGHVAARAGRDWPLLALAVAGVLVHSLLARRARRRWRSVLATALGAVAAGVAFTSALGGGDHALAELEEALGVPLAAMPVLTVAYGALAAVGLLVAACVSVHGATMAWGRRRSRVPA
jgi:hypothetical protein